MPEYTPNYNLKKPSPNDNYNIDDANGNMDLIDAQLKVNEDKDAQLDNKIETHTHDGTAGNGVKLSADNVVIKDIANHFQSGDVENALVELVNLIGENAATLATKLGKTEKAADSDKLDGQHANAFLLASAYTAADVLAKLKTVDGTGSGLDADLLDGMSAKSFFNAVSSGSTADPNATQDSYILTNHVNSPSNSYYWHILTMFYSSRTGNRAQFAIKYNAGTNEMYIRSCYSGTWTTWSRIWHTHNDGSGSGLDADKLRGVIPSQGADVNTIAQRNANGDLAVSSRIYFSNNDYMRYDDGANKWYVCMDGAEYMLWHVGNDGAGSGLSADNVQGYSQDPAPTANTLARRNASGDLYARLLNSNYASTNATINRIMTKNGSDDWVRPSTPEQVRAGMNVARVTVGSTKPTSNLQVGDLFINPNA